jgi:hypothetical protein
LNGTGVKYQFIGVLMDKELIPYSPSLYIIKAKVSCPYLRDIRYLVLGQKSESESEDDKKIP